MMLKIVMPMYNFIEYNDAYLKTSGSLWQYYRDDPALDNNSNIIEIPTNFNICISFKFKHQITGQRGNVGTKDVGIMVSLKYLTTFWRKPA